MATLAKTLMPLFLMTVIMFASLYFPVALVKEKVTVAITGALSGAVLLTAINSQLGSIGYLVAVEYAFYIFFALSTLCIVSVLAAERLRAAGKNAVAVTTERWTRIVFVIAVALVAAGGWTLWWSEGTVR
jgi:branched-chain amino acid transport system substrate-binding protein